MSKSERNIQFKNRDKLVRYLRQIWPEHIYTETTYHLNSSLATYFQPCSTALVQTGDYIWTLLHHSFDNDNHDSGQDENSKQDELINDLAALVANYETADTNRY